MIPVDRNTIMVGLLVVSIAGSLYLLSELRKTQEQVAVCSDFNEGVKQVLTAPTHNITAKAAPAQEAATPQQPTAADSEE
jgi:hypothetical protein